MVEHTHTQRRRIQILSAILTKPKQRPISVHWLPHWTVRWSAHWPLLSGRLHLVQYDDWYTGLALVGWAVVTFGTVWWLVHWPGPWVGRYIWYSMMIGTLAWPLLGGLLHLVQYDDWYTGLALVKWAVTFGTVWWLVHWSGLVGWAVTFGIATGQGTHPRTSTFTVLTTHPSTPACQSSYCYWMDPWFGHLQWQQHV